MMSNEDNDSMLNILRRIERTVNDIDRRLKSVESEVKRVKNEARSRG